MDIMTAVFMVGFFAAFCFNNKKTPHHTEKYRECHKIIKKINWLDKEKKKELYKSCIEAYPK
jgi:inorganic pyrophosphatase